MLTKEISFIDFQVDNLKKIKKLHSQQLMLGSGGYQRVTNAQWLALARELKDLHYPAFYKLMSQVQNRQLSEKQIRARLKQFAGASRSSIENGRKASLINEGWRYAKRELGSCAPHCQDCINYAALGIVSIADLIPPANQCAIGYRTIRKPERTISYQS